MSQEEIVEQLEQVNENLKGIYSLLHDTIHLRAESDRLRVLKALSEIEERLGSIEGNTL